MLRVGLTGGTGAGKSTVACRLTDLGATVVDADLLAREVLAPGTPGLAAVAEEFGAGVLADDGSLDRAALAAQAFSSAERRRALEAITHPAIAARTAELFAAAPSDAVVVHDVPLLVEKHLGPAYHLVLVVHAPVQTRVQRLVQRGMPADDARSRIAAQADDAARRAAADVWLDNSGTSGQLEAVVERLWHQRLVPFERNVRQGRPATGASRTPAGQVQHHLRRSVERVRFVLGRSALAAHVLDQVEVGVGVEVGASPSDAPAGRMPHLELRVPAVQDAGSMAGPLLAAGFARMGTSTSVDDQLYRSCDPGCVVDLRLVPGPRPAR